MRVAIVGAGISGLTVARLLCDEHDIVVFEAEDWTGGHAHTLDVEDGEGTVAVDTGFIVFNERNYPGFCRLLDRLDAPSKPTSMSFAVRDAAADFEYRASSLPTLFAQRRNLLRPDLYRMLADIVRFYREAPRAVARGEGEVPLGEYLRRGRYAEVFVRRHIVPMGAALWSAGAGKVAEFPLRHVVNFLENHGMLRFRGRPAWRVIRGGSREYVRRLVEPFADRIRARCPVSAVRRPGRGVEIRSAAGVERFDRVVLACHSDQALRLLADPSDREREILGAVPYTANEVVLHTDPAIMPRRRRAWSSWNVLVDGEGDARVGVTYWMNLLQGFTAARDYFVTLNRTASLDPERVIARFTYHHPLFTAAAVGARERRAEIDGVRDTHFCGAYWGYGFHEDGVASGLAVAAAFGKRL